MRRVILESPFAGNRVLNAEYLRLALLDSLSRGEAPFASHGLYPGALDDDNPEQRQLGIDAGLTWGAVAEATVVYADLGISKGMEYGIQNANAAGRPVIWRHISGYLKYDNGRPKFAPDGTMLDENGNRSIFDDVDL